MCARGLHRILRYNILVCKEPPLDAALFKVLGAVTRRVILLTIEIQYDFIRREGVKPTAYSPNDVSESP